MKWSWLFKISLNGLFPESVFLFYLLTATRSMFFKMCLSVQIFDICTDFWYFNIKPNFLFF